jgi:uncharacterized repeat protein (TIGR01451 family)
VCKPITGWEFTLGTGYRTRAVSGPWGSLSNVRGAYDTVIQTKASTPLLNQNGVQIGSQTIAGAVTVELTSAQRQQASNSSSLWAQGGTPSDPVLVGKFPGPQYAFGALRCATDALNGDNVEYVFFPSGVKHVFCYALYVSPPPTAGTITIKKQVTGAPAGDNPAFPFSGNISFDPNGFQLRDGESQDFPRAGGETWVVTESAVDNYALASVQCSAVSGGPGPPASTWTVRGSTTSINLAAEEHVTCVYTNRYGPPSGGLTISKITRGGTGSFDYVVEPASGGAQTHARATTRLPNVPVNAQPSPLSLAPGSYTIRELPTPSPDGSWRLVSVRCNGQAESTTGPVTVDVVSGAGTVCTFINKFTPIGSISLAKVTRGGTGTSSFVINADSTATQFIQRATTTTHAGVPADAKPDTSADATDSLPLGSHTIIESPPAGQAGQWGLTSVICNGAVVPFEQGAVTIQLTQRKPAVHCQFENIFNPHPPPAPPPVTPPGGGGSPDVYPTTDLAVTKQASPSTVTLGQIVTYRITVRNISHVTAERVVVTDQSPLRGVILSVHNPVGICVAVPQRACQLGNMKPGATVVVTVRAMTPFPKCSPRGGHAFNRCEWVFRSCRRSTASSSPSSPRRSTDATYSATRADHSSARIGCLPPYGL